MQSAMRRWIQLFFVLAAILGSFPVQAGYDFTIIDYPNAVLTQFFGINDSGHVVGVALFDDGSERGFVYDSRKGTFTVLPSAPDAIATAAIGINERGVVVGTATDGITLNEGGFILDDKGRFTLFSHPNFHQTEARAISDSGLVTGIAYNGKFFGSTGFIYDPKHNSFVDIFFPNSERIQAQGINGHGEVVGSANLPVGGAYAGSPAGSYGFLRNKHGAITLFRVDDIGNRTNARGITDSGRITGYFGDPLRGNANQGFVADLDTHSGFQLLQITTADLVNVPGAAGTVPQAIDNTGRVVGIVVDADGFQHGFIATPKKKKQ